MAKIALSKLGLTKNTETVKFNWNDQVIEVKQYLPIEEKLDLCAKIINESVDDNNFYNPGRVAIYQLVEIVLAYTNISVTEKQHDDIFKLFDLFSNGFAAEVYNKIGVNEINSITAIVEATIENIYKYKNSAMGILETISTDYNDLELSAENIQKALTKGEGVEFLKGVMDKLG